MSKVKSVIWVIGGMMLCYLILTAAWPVLTGIIDDIAGDLALRANIADYWGALEFLQFTPWLLYLVPAIIGIAVIVLILRRPE